MKKFILLTFLLSNSIFAQVKNDKIKVIEVIDYIIDNQKTIFNYGDKEIYTDSTYVKDFNFTSFKYGQIIKKESKECYALYFVNNEIKKIKFKKNNEIIELYLHKYKNFILANSPSGLADIICFDIISEKIIAFNFEVHGIIDNYFFPFDYSILKKIVQLDTNLKPISTNYLENLNLVAASKFLYVENTIYEEISIARLQSNLYYNIVKMDFSRLYYFLQRGSNAVVSTFKSFLVETRLPFGNGFFTYRDSIQDFPDVEGASPFFQNIPDSKDTRKIKK